MAEAVATPLEPAPVANLVQAQTLRMERFRAVSSGIVETAGSTFVLLFAVQQLNCGATAKALLSAGGSIGLLLTPLVLHWTARRGIKSARAAGYVHLAGAGFFLISALIPDTNVFIAASVLALTCTAASIPLMTQIYQDNYPAHLRGRLFSSTNMIRIAVAGVFAYIAGHLLNDHLEHYQWAMGAFALGMACSAFFLLRCPSRTLLNHGMGPFHALRFVRQDQVFRRTLISWMLMGFANLMMVPLRIEYMGNPAYGLALAPAMIALLNATIPNGARLILSPLWGRMFDRMNFFVLRICLNVGFVIGILAFFTGDTEAGLVFGAVIFGIAFAGGDVAWSLWVTKMAPPDHVADYMSVHTFLTGIRGVIAPLVAFHLLQVIDIVWLAAGCATLIVLASLLLIPEARAWRKEHPHPAPPQDV